MTDAASTTATGPTHARAKMAHRRWAAISMRRSNSHDQPTSPATAPGGKT